MVPEEDEGGSSLHVGGATSVGAGDGNLYGEPSPTEREVRCALWCAARLKSTKVGCMLWCGAIPTMYDCMKLSSSLEHVGPATKNKMDTWEKRASNQMGENRFMPIDVLDERAKKTMEEK
jgi:hypothetical protein